MTSQMQIIKCIAISLILFSSIITIIEIFGTYYHHNTNPNRNSYLRIVCCIVLIIIVWSIRGIYWIQSK
jgi:hypothetical protein